MGGISPSLRRDSPEQGSRAGESGTASLDAAVEYLATFANDGFGTVVLVATVPECDGAVDDAGPIAARPVIGVRIDTPLNFLLGSGRRSRVLAAVHRKAALPLLETQWGESRLCWLTS